MPRLMLHTAVLLTPLAALHADDSQKLTALLTSASEQGGVVTIPPGDYELDVAPTSRSAKTRTLTY